MQFIPSLNITNMKTVSDILQRIIPYEGKSHQWPQAFAVSTAALGALTSGSLSAWTSPAIPILTSNSSHIEQISLEAASYLTIIAPITGIFVSPLLFLIVDGIGRKKTIICMSALYFISWMLVAFSKSLIVLYISRLFQGVGDAALFTAVPMYIGEVSEPAVRVSWGNLVSFFVFFGQFFVNSIGSYCTIETTALIISSIPFIQILLMMLVPESPYFFLIKNRHEEAEKTLKILKWKTDIWDDLKSLEKDVQRQMSESGTFKDLFTTPINFRILLIAIGIRGSQQFSGLPAFFMYTHYMFNQAGGSFSAELSAIILSGLFTLFTMGSFFVIHRFGRKPLMTLSCLGCGIVLAVESVYFYIYEKTDIDTSHVNWLPLSGMIIFMIVTAFGTGPIPTIMLGELFPANIKAKAVSVVNVCFSIFTITVAKLFQTLSSNFGMFTPFCMFSVCCFVNVVFCYYFVPETRGKTLEEIQQNIRNSK